MIRRAPMARTVHEVDLVARLRIIVRPSRGAVTEAHVMEHLAAASMHEHHGMWMPHLFRGQKLHVHLPGLNRTVRHFLALSADPEKAGIGELHRGLAHARAPDGG